jgi:Protein of unknown function (DUF3179)
MKVTSIMFLAGFVLYSCATDPATNNSSLGGSADGWLIPKNEVFDGGPGKDGIPSIDNPKMVAMDEVDFLEDNDLVVLFSKGGKLSIYAHKILDWHEIVNDVDVTVSYCPLTGTSIGINRNLEQNGLKKKTSFGVSGLLYNTNLILYDRLTDSYWSQMKNQCVAGDLVGTFPQNEILVETTYKTVKEMFGSAQVLSNRTGYYSKEQYGNYPYGDYKTNDNRLLFPVSNTDVRVPGKERVLGVLIGNDAQAFRLSSFTGGTNVINSTIGGEAVVVVGNNKRNFSVAYKSHFTNKNTNLTFASISESGQSIFKDNLGNNYNILGEVVSGPNIGERLAGTHSYMSFWFAWAAFYPATGIN